MPDIYYKSGGVWRELKQVWYRDAGTWKRLKAIWYRDAGTWKKVYQSAGPVNPLEGGFAEMTTLYTGDPATAGWRFSSDGRVRKRVGGNEYDDHLWYDPQTTGIGGSYFVRLTKTSGTASLPNSGAWQALTSGVLVSVTQTMQGMNTLTFTAEIAETAGGTVLTSGSYTVWAIVEL